MPDHYTLEDADAERLAALSGISCANNSVHLEVLYRDRWVRFDLSGMETLFASPSDLFTRHFDRVFKDLGLDRSSAVQDTAVSSSSQSTV